VLYREYEVKERDWTVIIVPHATGAQRTVFLSRRRIKVVAAFLMVCVAVLVRFGYGYLQVYQTADRLSSAERSNAAMSERIESLEERNKTLNHHVDSLNEDMTEIVELEQRIRELAGLTKKPAGGDITEVAIGGRGGPADEDDGFFTGYDPAATEGGVNRSFDDMVDHISEYKTKLADLTAVIETERRRMQSLPCIHPTDGTGVWKSSSYGWRKNPFSGNRQFHQGIDFAGPLGTPVIAAGDGKVESAKWDNGLGWFVVIDHGFGYRTRYGHNEKLVVKVGETVKRGDTLALLGSTGKSTGPHVHYEVLLNGKAQDPAKHFLD
jgi:murein DD-endopeptidase MepM/ murein hydrolase activator NlpD